MPVTTVIFRIISSFPPLALFVAAPCLVLIGLLTAVHLYTISKYRQSLIIHTSAPAKSTQAIPPPPIPYTVPFLGHAIAFLAPNPGQFWADLFRSYPRATGACTLLLGGNSAHILFSPSAIEAMFKARSPSRDGFNQQIVERGLGLDRKEGLRIFGVGEGPDHTGTTPAQQQEETWLHYLLEKKSVNELTANFTRVLRDRLAGELKREAVDGREMVVDIYAWLQDRMFSASTTALMGSRLLEICPNFREDFFEFDRHMLTLFFQPKLLSSKAYSAREKVLGGLIEWQKQMQEECGFHPVDPDGDVDWNPVFGSRANRARQRYYESRGVNVRTRAGMDLGFLFGLNSNAIPAAGWMLMHILNPDGEKTLLSRVMEELAGAERGDGSLDVPTLIALPLLQSIFHEVLRVYADVLVSRELREDLTLPLEDGKRRMLLGKNGVVMAPSWLNHRDDTLWTGGPPCNQFHAERFLRTDTETGHRLFSTGGTSGRYFPFGGGKTICPGRVFAKQEVLASVASVLLSFDIEPVGFVDRRGGSRETFPGLGKTYPGSGILVMDGDMRVKIKGRRGPRG